MDLRGDPEGPVEGTVVEAKLVRGRGYVFLMQSWNETIPHHI